MERVVPSPGLNNPGGNNTVTLAPLALFTNQLPTVHLRTDVKRCPATKHAVSTNCLLRMRSEKHLDQHRNASWGINAQ